MEILSPVKNFDSAKVVIQNGADAIYLASTHFGARTNASIELDEIEEIINYANLYSVFSYVTFNTVIFESELNAFFTELNKVYNFGATGVIIQDVSLIKILKNHYPDLEIHCSTQMHISNTPATTLIQSLGAQRVIVPREMNFARIKQLKLNTNVEIEAFIHGALCVCYSGRCYDSMLLDQKSANRGRCSQYCRMPQQIINTKTNEVITTGRYPLNLKDLNNIDNLEQYEKCGINAIKIEGRLKQIEYAGLTTYLYKKKLNNRDIETANQLQQVYNRTHTSGLINNVNGKKLVNLERPNNNGELIGNVLNVQPNTNKEFGFYKNIVTVEINVDLSTQDVIRYVDTDYEEGHIVEQINPNNPQQIYTNNTPPVGSQVFRTLNSQLQKHMINSGKKFSRRKSIPLLLRVIDNKFQYKIKHDWQATNIELENSITKITTKEDILTKLLKTNNTPFAFDIISFNYAEDKFIGFSKIKELKSLILEEVVYLNTKKRNNFPIEYQSRNIITNSRKETFFIQLRNENQYMAVKKFNDVLIMFSNPNLIPQAKAEDVFILPRIIYDDELEELQTLVSKFTMLCASDIGGLHHFKNKEIITNYTLNITNQMGLNFLEENNVKKSIISIELNFEKIKALAFENSIVNVYGRVPVMIMDYCPINLNKQDDCGACHRCHNESYILKDEYDREFPLLYEGNSRLGMYSKQPINLLSKIDELKTANIANFHLNFTTETAEEITSILECLFNDGPFLKGDYSKGSYFKNIL